jgi:RimJ/RimL family protein N-acetyltransferase
VAGVLATPKLGEGGSPAKFALLQPRAIRTFCDYAFQQLRIHRLFATPFSSNLASHRALEKAGFQREGLLRHHHLKQGTYLDAIVYGRISESNKASPD